MFNLCEAMRWNHLPVQGGLYDQNPGLMDRFYYILSQKSQHEARENEKKNDQMGRGAGLRRPPGRGRGRRR